MIAFSKGNLDKLLDYNFIWSALFMIIYYIMGVFILHAAFHMTQTDALMNVVLLFSLAETDVVSEPKKVVDMDPKKFAHMRGLEIKFQVMFWLQWLTGWLPKEKRNSFKEILEKVIPPTG